MASPVVYRQKRALVIGINTYRRDQLYFCINDAEDLGATLKSIDFCVSLALNCNWTELYHIIDTFAGTVQCNDLVLFYFAGHGKQSSDENYLLPSDYNFDYRGTEHDYIVKNAVNVKYIMGKLDSKKCRVAIYLFDCCRSSVRTRVIDAKQGLSSINGLSQTLIVFACAPNRAVLDETDNNRNGSFIENLLKHITIPNKHIEEIMQDVADDVYLQTRNYQLPYRTSSITGKVFLVLNNDQVEAPKQVSVDRSLETHPTNRHPRPNSILAHQNNDPFRNPSRSPEYPPDFCSSDDDDVSPINLQPPQSRNDTNVGILPSIKPRKKFVPNTQRTSDSSVPLKPIKDPSISKPFGKPQGQRPPSVKNNYATPITPKRSNTSLSLASGQSNENRYTQVYSSQKTDRPKSRNDEKYVYDSNISSSSEHDDDNSDIPQTPKKTYLKGDNNPKPISNLAQPVYSDSQSDSDITADEQPMLSSRVTLIEPKHETRKSWTSSNNSKPLVVRICTLFQRHFVKIFNNTTVKDLLNIIWNEIKFDRERYTKDSHILLLFNHRLHIFVESDPTALVKDFLSLSPVSHSTTNDATDFYIYGIPRQHASSMYKIDNDYSSLFGNPDSWCPSYFIDYKQSERPQSILLSSLYTLRLYFKPETEELMAKQLAMEAQFFLQLRKYLFPPSILALKHAIIGSMFWFEKALLMDGLIQLLTHLCDPEKIFPTEICDFIPLLICWLLEKCDPTAEKEDCFREVTLINARRSYFQNPVTTSKTKRQALLLEEFEEATNDNELQYHVDIRSLTLYLSRLTKTSPNVTSNCHDYIIYDPILQDAPRWESLTFWTEIQIKELYKTIAQTRDYRSFSILTRGALTADVKNQLVLLQKDRTVAIIFSPKNVIRSNAKTARDVDRLFQIFDPLKCTKDASYLAVASDIFLDERSQLPDPRLPTYFNNSLTITNSNTDPLLGNNLNVPAHQVTIILLDRSQSMSDYRITSSDKTDSCSHIDICKMMLGRLSDNLVSTNEVNAFGRIEFAKNFKTICPITRSREQFERALNSDHCSAEWTCMYDAILEAIKQIKTFTDSPLRATKDCRKLIICLSDGINNYGQTTIQNLRDLIRRNKILIDFISFIRDDQLKKKEEVDKAGQFRKLCIDSGGCIYKNLQVLSDIELASVFEQEAAVWLSKRSKTSCGIVDKPERYIPPTFKEIANRQPPSTQDKQNSRRILNEFKAMLTYPSDDVIVFTVPNNISFWKVILKGPVGTPYQGQFWMLYLEFDSNYPKCPPNVRFITPIYHVNISGDGKICHEILGRCWCQETKTSVIFNNILDLLKNPRFDDAMSLEKAHLFKENPADYRRQAEAHSKKYAKNNIKSLKLEHRLEDNDD